MEDMMVFTAIYNSGLSGFTGYYLEDTGFYKMNTAVFHDIQYGKKAGCGFVDQKCIDSNGQSSLDIFKCTPTSKLCTPGGFGSAYCGVPQTMIDSSLASYYNYYGNNKKVSNYYDYCPIPQYYNNGICNHAQSFNVGYMKYGI